jgi:hypothetical protein
MVTSSAGLGPESSYSRVQVPRVTALARPRSNCTSKLHIHPLVREGALHQETHNCQTENKDLVISSRHHDTLADRPLVANSLQLQLQLQNDTLPFRRSRRYRISPCKKKKKILYSPATKRKTKLLISTNTVCQFWQILIHVKSSNLHTLS